MSDLLTSLRAEVGVLRHSEWLVVNQSTIDRFADVTFDQQFIHVDPVRAAATPFGGTIAHGFLTLSLLSHLADITELPLQPAPRMTVNYGFDYIRFVHPVSPGDRIRGAFTAVAAEEKRSGQIQQTLSVVIEIEGEAKPALAATWLCQFFV